MRMTGKLKSCYTIKIGDEIFENCRIFKKIKLEKIIKTRDKTNNFNENIIVVDGFIIKKSDGEMIVCYPENIIKESFYASKIPDPEDLRP